MGIKESTGQFLRKCVEKNSTFLFGAAAAGWILASAAQTIGLIANKNITKEEKKFLVPQEILDGTFNIATYAAVTCTLMKAAESLVKKTHTSNHDITEGAKTLAAVAGGIISSNIITPILRNKSSVIIKEKMENKNLEKPSLDIYDGKTQLNFQAKRPLSMNTYINFTKNVSLRNNLKI